MRIWRCKITHPVWHGIREIWVIEGTLVIMDFSETEKPGFKEPQGHFRDDVTSLFDEGL